ncbi:MAG: ABC transporter substrate-binding protein [Burkholderiales bacterium]|nr:ABC transporter substrate-binding protein [Burkholderiales bacterium]
MVDRRTVITALPLLWLAGTRFAAAAGPLVLWGPPAAPSIILAQAAATAFPAAVAADGATFRTWKTPDEMRAGISSGSMEAVVVPTYVAANLYNRGLGLRLVNVLTDGLLYVVAPPGTVAGITGLKGKRVAVPFRNDMPDYILRRLLASAGLTPGDLDIDYSGTPPEAVQMLLAGRVQAALLSEPAASGAIARAHAAGKPLAREVNCQQAWGSVAGRTTIPQAGLAVSEKLAARIGVPGLEALQACLVAALQVVRRDPGAAAAAAAPAFGLPAAVLEQSLATSNLVVRTASAARDDLAMLFDVLAKDDPRIIGGRQPDTRFYAL